MYIYDISRLRVNIWFLFTVFTTCLRDGLRRQMLHYLTENRRMVTRNTIGVNGMALTSIIYWYVFMVCIKIGSVILTTSAKYHMRTLVLLTFMGPGVVIIF